MVKVVRIQSLTFFFFKNFLSWNMRENDVLFLWVTKSAKLTNYDGFSQKYFLKMVKIVFDAFNNINEWTYVSNSLIFYKKSTKRVKGVHKGQSFRKIIVFSKFWLFLKISNFALFFTLFLVWVQKFHIPSLSPINIM